MVNYLYDKRSQNWLDFLSTLPNKSKAWKKLDGNVSSLKRQAETVQLIIQAYTKNYPGIIVADDVGLGKTWIGILAAIAWASSGFKVLIVTPNQTLREKWSDEFNAWYGDDPNPALWAYTEDEWNQHHPGVTVTPIDESSNPKLMTCKIVIMTAKDFKKRKSASCDLLIVDEAHRGQAADSTLDQICHKAPKAFRLLLTATPFGKNIGTLQKLLEVARAEEGLIESVGKANNMLIKPESLNLDAFECIVNQLRKWIVRHTIDTLPLSERRSLGEARHVLGSLIPPDQADGDHRREIIREPIKVSNPDIKQLMLHAERLRQLCPKEMGGAETLVAPFSAHGLREISKKINEQSTNAPQKYHLDKIEELCVAQNGTRGPMEQALYEFAKVCFEGGEKFIVFCYHHEVADAVYEVLKQAADEVCKSKHWHTISADKKGVNQRPPKPSSKNVSSGDGHEDVSNDEDVDEPEQNLASEKTGDRSGLWEFKYLSCHEKLLINETIDSARDELVDQLDGNARDLDMVETLKENGKRAENIRLYFNSPFFPMALVATTKDSEGIDLHRYCRIVVHYELGYRPETLLQANGRVRRIGSWAGRTKKPILYYYPYLEGTRSEALTREVLRRVERFGHFMGGVPEMNINELAQDAEIHDKGIPEPELPELDFSNGGFCRALHLP